MSDDAIDLVQANDAEQLRAQSIWFIASVACATWAFFCVFLFAMGFILGGFICFQQTVVYVCAYFLFRKSTDYSTFFNFVLVCGAIGLCSLSLSGASLRPAIYFLPVSILMCSQLFGIRMAFRWTAISIVTMMFFFIGSKWVGAIETKPTYCLLAFGSPVCMFFCCQQAEKYYARRTHNLVNFSKALKAKSDELELLATTDSLTGLTNRYRFQLHLDRYVENSKHDESAFALFLVDMDGFKEINDTMGHSIGDEVLVEIAKRLEEHFVDRSIVARIGGDEFCLLVGGVANDAEAVAFGEEVHRVLTKRYKLTGDGFTLGSSIGYAICPQHAETSKHLLAFADTAMYHAKQNQQAIAAYAPRMTELLVETREMNDRLAHALEREEFFLVYQPQLNLETGQIIGVEALLRWQTKNQLISPGKFIPLLEQSGRIMDVGRWVIREACRQQAAWKEQHGVDLRIAVNVSAVQFEADQFVESIASPVREFNVEPEKIELEITEGLLINNIPNVVSKLKQIKELGMRISIDDFGTGYSSLAYLRQFPIDKLKIDQAFVRDFPEHDDGVIASSIIILGHLLGMKVLAEGVETQEQLDHLRLNGCDQYQGYFFSKPISPDQVCEMFVAEQETGSVFS